MLVKTWFWLVAVYFAGALCCSCAHGGEFTFADAVWKQENGKFYLEGESIEAIVTPDGCLESFRVFNPGESRVHVPNLLKYGFGLPEEHGMGGSRGGFFYQDTTLSLSEIQLIKPNRLRVESAKASVDYEAVGNEIKIYLINKTEQPLQYFWVLNPSIIAVAPVGQKPESTPKIARWTDTDWYWDKKTMSIRGTTSIWGPGAIVALSKANRIGQFQVTETLLQPSESKTLTITAGISTKEQQDEVALVADPVQGRGTGPSIWLAPKPALQTKELTLLSPADYQVFQRATRKQGRILISGRLQVACDNLSYRLNGKSISGEYTTDWIPLPLKAEKDGFTQWVDVPAGGWYKLELQGKAGASGIITASIAHVGVGEVFVGCGQSNSTNNGGAPTKTETGMVSAFSGESWQLANDPQPGAYDTSRWGSFWPAFGDALYEQENVPVGVAVTGRGGAPVSNWRPGSQGFCWTMTRIAQLGPGGFRALLWHQGESNSRSTEVEYIEQLSSFINASRAVAGWYFPWFVATASYHNPKESHFDQIRSAQQKVCESGLAFSGPDTDTLQGEDRAGIHLSVSGLKKHGQMWAKIIGDYIDRIEK